MLCPTPETQAAADRRRSPRQTFVIKGLLTPEASVTAPAPLDDAPRRVYVSNISMLGVGFHSPRDVTPGRTYRISLEAGPVQVRRQVRVVSCTRRQPEVYEVGAEFVGPDTGAAAPRRPSPERVPRNPSRGLTPRGSW